jgi:hypothetical protein
MHEKTETAEHTLPIFVDHDIFLTSNRVRGSFKTCERCSDTPVFPTKAIDPT